MDSEQGKTLEGKKLSAEELPLTAIGAQGAKNLQETQERMEKKYYIIIAVVILILVVLGIALGVYFGTKNKNDTNGEPEKYEALIKGKAINFMKTQDSRKDENYYKFVPKLKSVVDNGSQDKVTFKKFIENIGSNQDFLDDFIHILKDGTDFDEYFFECTSITKSAFQTKEFEFVLKKTTGLATTTTGENRVANFQAFENNFKSNCVVTDFPFGVRKDSHYVCPCPPEKQSDYEKFVHLARFVKEAPKGTIDTVFKKAFNVLSEKINEKDAEQKWYLSTDGKGTAWLHIRIGERPKYYIYDPYRFSEE